jgi:hypothetical protein
MLPFGDGIAAQSGLYAAHKSLARQSAQVERAPIEKQESENQNSDEENFAG